MQTFKLIFILGLFILAACASEELAPDGPIREPESRVFSESYDKVWRAIQLALKRYPIIVNNYDAGVLETKLVKGDALFEDPNEYPGRGDVKYKITLRAVKGVYDGRSAVKVTILKSGEVQKDFFSGVQSVPSNGLEELSLLYRISRHLEIDRIITKATEKPKP